MVLLHQCGKGPHAPSLSPFIMKLETFLKVAQIPYQVCRNKTRIHMIHVFRHVMKYQDRRSVKSTMHEYNSLLLWIIYCITFESADCSRLQNGSQRKGTLDGVQWNGFVRLAVMYGVFDSRVEPGCRRPSVHKGTGRQHVIPAYGGRAHVLVRGFDSEAV